VTDAGDIHASCEGTSRDDDLDLPFSHPDKVLGQESVINVALSVGHSEGMCSVRSPSFINDLFTQRKILRPTRRVLFRATFNSFRMFAFKATLYACK
jgi:hypothetical protein